MTPFTDEDLKRLKKDLDATRRVDHMFDNPIGEERFQTISALIARMEAAERVCDTARNRHHSLSWPEMFKAIEAWRKAAGK